MPNSNVEKLLLTLQDYAAQTTIVDLLEAGIDVNYTTPLLDIFKSAVLSSANYSDLIDELQVFVNGTDKQAGVLERYIKQVTSDALTQYNANYSQILSDDLGLEFYKYVGNRQDDTRCFCDERVNNFYHKKEIEKWGEGKNIGDCKQGTHWQGAYKGTNSTNIFIYRGGYNCEHQFISVSENQVPKDVILRNIDSGNYKPSNFIKNKFDL